MSLIPFFRRKHFFSSSDQEAIVAAIKRAEKETSGEVRVFVESRCRFVNPIHRAEEIFWGLKMDSTGEYNAVLIYVAIKDQQFAIFADNGIYTKLGNDFWNQSVNEMTSYIKEEGVAHGLVKVIDKIGSTLKEAFPYDPNTDKNELPDEIVFGQ